VHRSYRGDMPQQPLAQVPVDAVWDWQEHGSCRTADPTLFFHPQNERGSARRSRDLAAKAVCASCPVRIECADYAVRAREPYGVWGGLTEEEREAIYARIDLAEYPRTRGEGARMAAPEIDAAIRPLFSVSA
jgi:WhiB family transcriptional regulator, redox-sensing transcriptional regulator